MKNNNINPIGLKGNQINERMKELMGIASIDENKTSSRVELTKIGPDGKAYAIVRENHEYFIKSTDKKTNIVSEDFKYIGGLQNIKSEVYKSYSSAIKHLNLKFNSLAESFNTSNGINVFKNDNLLTEAGFASFSSESGNGFVGDGNLEGSQPIEEYDSYNDEPGYDDIKPKRKDSPRKKRWDTDDDDNDDDRDNDDLYENEEEVENEVENDVELSEAEQAITDMCEEEEDESMPENPEDYTKQPGYVHEHKLSISRAIDNMDAIIDTLGESKKKVYTLK
jgi:hypothetical protein